MRIEKRMLLMASHHPKRRSRSRPRSAASAVEAQRRALTDSGAEGKSPLRTSRPDSVADINERSVRSEKLRPFVSPDAAVYCQFASTY